VPHIKGCDLPHLLNTMSNLLTYQLEYEMEKSFQHIENLKNKVIKAKKIQLHTGLEGFESPESFGIYRNTGGSALGVVGSQFMPCDLELFLDAIQLSVMESGMDLDLTKLEYTEYYQGSKVGFKLPYKTFEIKTPMVGDTISTNLEFRTGFDGKTKMSIGFYSWRYFCANGAKNYKKDVDLSLKNTTNNQAKLMTFTNEIITAANEVENYVTLLNESSLKSIKQSDIDNFLTKLTGYNVKEYSELTTRKRNILDKINQAIEIERQNTGTSYFSLLQGITRYTTHDLAKNDIDSILFSSANQMNEMAHQLVFASLN
jgi:hypothetical protein